MPDGPTPAPQTPGQALIGQPQAPPPPPNAGNMPLYSRPGQPPSLPAQPPAPQQAPPQPTPQQVAQIADHNRHAAIGKAASFLFGQQRDPETGAAVKAPAGQLFRNLLAGALLGGAIGSEGHAGGGSVGGFLGGMGRGASGVEQQNYQRQQQAQELAMKRQTMSLEEQKFAEQKTQHAAQLEQWNVENLARGREADYRDRDQLDKENEQDQNIQKWAVENGAYLASIPNNGVPGNGPGLMKAMINDPGRFQPPAGTGRLLVKHYDFDGLEHDAKNGWTEDGKPVDWSKHLTWSVYYAPSASSQKQQISMSGADWTRLYGVKFPPGSDPDQMYNVKAVAPLISVATTNRKQEREDSNQSFKEKHDALQGTINSARTNVTQLESEKRQLIGQGFTEDDKSVQEIQGKIDAEQKREQDAIDEMHPRIRQRVQQQAPAAPARTGATPAVKPRAQKTPSGPPAGATMKVPGSDGKLHWSDGKNDLGVAQ